MTQKSLQELAVEYDLNGSELMAVSNYLISIRISNKAISPQKAINIINNFHKVESAINQLAYLTKLTI